MKFLEEFSENDVCDKKVVLEVSGDENSANNRTDQMYCMDMLEGFSREERNNEELLGKTRPHQGEEGKVEKQESSGKRSGATEKEDL